MSGNGKRHSFWRRAASRLTAGAMALALMAGVLPACPPPQAKAVDAVMQGYLDKVVEWGIMRGDVNGNLNPERLITRAEFVTLVNRAFGYDRVGENPFDDVKTSDWFADDINIAYQSGYFAGTSEKTASPSENLTREQAAVLLGRNLMLEPAVGEVTDFTDSRSIGTWSRGIVKASADRGVVKGYPDGSFRPKNQITRGAVASLLVNAIGTPINRPGDYTLGSVYGNVTISSSGVTLRDTTIAGDLYVTGGVGLGYVTLENVNVLGRIVTSGAGESNEGSSSVNLRNVTASEMIVDSMANQFVTVRAEGSTQIDKTYVRTPAMLEDATVSDLGLRSIVLDGEEGTTVDLAGNIKEFTDLTPKSQVRVSKGSVNVLTMDEDAVGSTLVIDRGAEVKKLNLDVGCAVSGLGDISDMTVGAAGCISTILPDLITIRPGLTANIAGQVMDTNLAYESSQDPRLLSGYPKAADVAPTSFSALFETNKQGTVYWALTPVSEGSTGEADLLNPPAYASKILKSGNLNITSSNKKFTAKVTGLTANGSYYLSALLKDARGVVSPVKVTALTAPDSSVPNFATGYPYMSKITKDSAYVTVMPTKSCQLYYALLVKGSTAPAAADFRAGAVSGNWGFGSMDVIKNTTSTFMVNSKLLKELDSYDLYLWLTDADNGASSSVKKLSFTTVDGTPPRFNTDPGLTPTSVKETALGFSFSLTEPGTVYWVAVAAGTSYPKPLAGGSGTPALSSNEAKLQVANGMNALKSGRVAAGAANKDTALNATGLTAETSYDIYYLAEDKAGNYSAAVEKITANTLDNSAPTVTQKFNRYNGTDTGTPLPDTDVQLVFSEGIQVAPTADGVSGKSFLELYNEVKNAKTEADRLVRLTAFTDALRSTVTLYVEPEFSQPEPVAERTADSAPANWTIDYRFAAVSQDDKQVIITFPTTADPDTSALRLQSGATYYFEVSNISDISNAKNVMGVTKLPSFTTMFAQVSLAGSTSSSISDETPLDISFRLNPLSTSSVDEQTMWDMLLWCDTSVKFDLYLRELDRSTGAVKAEWEKVNSGGPVIIVAQGGEEGISLHSITQRDWEPVKALDQTTAYEYGISFTEVDSLTGRDTWSQLINVRVAVAAAGANALDNLANKPSEWAGWKLSDGASIGVSKDSDELSLKKQFQDKTAPVFIDNYPTFEPGDSIVKMTVMLDRPGTLYYVVAQPRHQTAVDVDGNPVPVDDAALPPTSGIGELLVKTPATNTVVSPRYTNTQIKTDHKPYSAGAMEITVTGLEPNTQYFVYLALKGAGSVYSDNPYCYQFTTTNVKTPTIDLVNQSPAVQATTSEDSLLSYALFATDQLPAWLKSQKVEAPTGGTDADGNPTYTEYTLLDALMETPGGTGASIFDKHASATQKKLVQELVQGTSSSAGSQPVQAEKDLTTAKNDYNYYDCAKSMIGATQYYLLAVARNQMGDTYGFKAVANIHLPDTTPPEFVSVTTNRTTVRNLQTGSQVTDGSWQDDPTNYMYSGTLTINFSEELYQLYEDPSSHVRTLKAVWLSGASGSAVNLLDICGGNVQMFNTTGTNQKYPAQNFTFNFDKATHGSTLILFNNGKISDASSSDTNKKLYLTFDATQQGTGFLGNLANPQFIAEWR